VIWIVDSAVISVRLHGVGTAQCVSWANRCIAQDWKIVVCFVLAVRAKSLPVWATIHSDIFAGPILISESPDPRASLGGRTRAGLTGPGRRQTHPTRQNLIGEFFSDGLIRGD